MSEIPRRPKVCPLPLPLSEVGLSRRQGKTKRTEWIKENSSRQSGINIVDKERCRLSRPKNAVEEVPGKKDDLGSRLVLGPEWLDLLRPRSDNGRFILNILGEACPIYFNQSHDYIYIYIHLI